MRILWATAVFAVGCLALAIVVWLAQLVIGMLALPAPISQIALIVLGIIGLVLLIMAAVWAFQNPPKWPMP